MNEQSISFSTWVSIGSALAAFAAAGFAYWSARSAHRAIRLAEQQELRRRPVLLLYLVDGYVHRHSADDSRFYAFLISISNRSDADNAIARLDLRISYRTSANFCAAVDIPAGATQAAPFGGQGQATVRVPLRIDAHQTMTGWVHFEIKNALLRDCNVDYYTILVTDTHGERSAVEASLVREFVDEAKAKVG